MYLVLYLKTMPRYIGYEGGVAPAANLLQGCCEVSLRVQAWYQFGVRQDAVR